MRNTLTVFLCSTFADLSDERERVLDAVNRLQLQHDSMEFFGARSDLPIETCLAEVRRSDVLVVIVGHRYGSLVPDLSVSFSEAEYREGYRLGKPCLVYLRDDNVPVLPKHIERDPDKIRLLDNWRETLTKRHTVATFRSSQDLAVQVAADLARTIQALEEAQRARANSPVRPGDVIASELLRLFDDAIQKGVSSDVLISVIRRAVADVLASSGRRRPLVFLSHSHADKPKVRLLADGLRTAGIDVWIDEAELKLGDSLVAQIERGLDSADFVAVFLSKAFLHSAWARQELNVAISRQITGARGAVVLPILLEDTEIPSLLRDVMYLDMRDGDVNRGVDKLVHTITRYQIERAHTYSTGANRYFNPADKILQIGRRVQGASFFELVAQLHRDEVLIGLYRNQEAALVATHLHSRDRMEEMEGLWAPAEGFFAVHREDVNEGLDNKIPPPG